MSETVIYVRETKAEEIIRDIITISTISAIIGIGVFLDSSAMQWVGFVISILVIFGRATKLTDSWRCTPQEVADKLKEKYGVVAE